MGKFTALMRGQVLRHPVFFEALTGSHLYGFATPKSDMDIRGAHVIPLVEYVGLRVGDQHIKQTGYDFQEAVSFDIQSADVSAYFNRILKRNMHIMEEIYAPDVYVPENMQVFFDELRSLALGYITVKHSAHYLGMAKQLYSRARDEGSLSYKVALHVFRNYFSGIHLMRTKQLECNLITLLNEFPDYIPDVKEIYNSRMDVPDGEVRPRDKNHVLDLFQRLDGQLIAARDASSWPKEPPSAQPLNDLLVRIRLSSMLTGIYVQGA